MCYSLVASPVEVPHAVLDVPGHLLLQFGLEAVNRDTAADLCHDDDDEESSGSGDD